MKGRTPKPVKDTSSPGICQAGSGLTSRRRDRSSRRSPSVGANAAAVSSSPATPEGVDLEIRVEISARTPDGYPEDKGRTVTENARTLKFETYAFENR